jgi:DNA-binding transcriptional ArsR family regulator
VIGYTRHMTDVTPFSADELAALLPRLQATLDLLAVAIRHKVVIEQAAGAARQTPARPAATTAPSAPRTAPRTATAPAPSAPRQKRRSPRQSEHLRGRVLDALKTAKGGVAASAIVEQLKASPEAVGYALRKLRGERLAKMTGERGGARWHVAAK